MKADIEYHGHGPNSPLDDPVTRRLNEYGRATAFVVGPRAEMSSDVQTLIDGISDRAAEVKWRGVLATDIVTAKGVIRTHDHEQPQDPRCAGQCRVLGGQARHHARGRAGGVRQAQEGRCGQQGGVRGVQQALLLRRR